MRFASTLAWAMCIKLLGQEIDTGNFAGSRRGSSLLDRAESDAERSEFARLQKTTDAAKRRTLANEFLAQYPRSWLLASAYQISAVASLELKDDPRLLADGRASLRLLPENPPLLLAVAQVELSHGMAQQARNDASDAILWLSVLTGPSGTKPSDWRKTRKNLEEYARAILARTGGAAPPREAALEASGSGKGEKFAGSESCKACHRAIYDSWRQTGMATMLQSIKDARILADFGRLREFSGDGGAQLRIGGGDRPYFEFSVAGGWKRFPVDYTIGSKWQQAYATRLADERIFVFPLQYSAFEKKWVNYWAAIDPPGSERAHIGRFPQLSNAVSYQRNCAVCHTSQLRLLRLDDDTMQRAAFREVGVNCEMCHGPSTQHAAGQTTEGGPPFRFARLNHVDATLICGQCHRQSALRDLGSRGEMNYRTGRPYYNRLMSQPYAEFGTRAFYKDGRFRETTFIGEAFMRSACFRRGTAQCASCHDPHPSDAAENRMSVKFRSDPDQMCLQCHTALAADLGAHTRHPVGSAGSRCVACHMPPIMNSLLFKARSHQIDDIPRVELTARFGQEQSPNACLVCHAERSTEWVAHELAHWPKTRPLPR